MASALAKIFGFSQTLSGFVRMHMEAPVVTILRSIRDIEEDAPRSVSEIFMPSPQVGAGNINALLQIPSASTPVAKPVIFDVSQSGMKTLTCTVTSSTPPALLVEVNSPDRVFKIDITDIHGKFVSDSFLGGVSWSSDERYVCYVAQAKQAKKSTSFEIDGSSSVTANKFDYEEDWGEKYVGVSTLVLVLVDTNEGRVSVLDSLSLDPDITVGCPSFSPAASSYDLVYSRWRNTPKKLGMIYCYHRPCEVLKVDVSKLLIEKDEVVPQLVSRGLALARSGRIHPDGKSVIFIGRKEPLDCHNGCFELYRTSLESVDSEPERLLSIVDKPCGDLPTDLPEEALSKLVHSLTEVVFPGLYTDQLPRRCFSSDGSRIYFTSQWGFSEAIISLDLQNKALSRLQNLTEILEGDSSDGSAIPSCSIIDICNDWLLYSASSPNCPSKIALTKLGEDSIWISPKPRFFGISSKKKSDTPLGTDLELTYRFIKDMSWKILSHVSSNGIPFQSLLVTPKRILPERKLPLVLVPHGGPHSGFTNSFLASTACFAMNLDAAVLLVNYRGSIGYGQRSIDSLLGGIGRNDVDDMVQAVHLTLSNEEYIDANRLFVVGGSHGGFLTAHLIGQFPTMFRAAAMRNPVTNIPPMASVSDIPDWCHVEASGAGSYEFDSFRKVAYSSLEKMYSVSPIAHIEHVVTPTLLLLGAKDRRVPYSQGLEYYHILRSRGVESRLLVFPEDNHALDRPLTEAEQWIAVIDWFLKHEESKA